MAVKRSKRATGGNRRRGARSSAKASLIPAEARDLELEIDGHKLKLTNLQKSFWPELGLTKGDLLRYYAEIAPVLLPHLVDRAMVMKRYLQGAAGPFFFQKRVPEPHPDWIETCAIKHSSGSMIDFAIVRDLASLLWTVNLGCIDLNPWYARCDDVHRPDYLHFDLDPVGGASFDRVLQTALLVHQTLDALGMPNLAKTTGSRGIHVYVPIVRGPRQKEVWTFAKNLARELERFDSALITTEYRVAKRPQNRVLVDYNQNAWGRTLASVYSVRPKPHATVSAPVSWEEVKRGIRIEDFRLDNVPPASSAIGRSLETAAAAAWPVQIGKCDERNRGSYATQQPLGVVATDVRRLAIGNSPSSRAASLNQAEACAPWPHVLLESEHATS